MSEELVRTSGPRRWKRAVNATPSKGYDEKKRVQSAKISRVIDGHPRLERKEKYGLRPVPHEEGAIKYLADEFMEFIKTNRSLTVDRFALDRNLSLFKFYKLAEKSEYFREMLINVKAWIAEHLHEAIINETIDPNYARSLLPLYNNSIKEFMLEMKRAAAAKLESQGPVKFEVRDNASIISEASS